MDEIWIVSIQMEVIEQFPAILSTVVQADRCFSAQSPKYDCLMK